MSIITHTIYNIYNSRRGAVLLLGLLLGSLAGFSQNTPNVVQSVVPGSIATGGGAPVPAYDINFTPSGMRQVASIVPRKRDTASVNYHVGTSPVDASRSLQYLDGRGRAVQSIIPAFAKNGSYYSSLYSATDQRTTTESYSFKSYVITGIGTHYEPNALYMSEEFHNTSSRYPEEGGAASNMQGLSVTKVSNTSSATERSSTTYLPGLARTGQNRGVKTSIVFNKVDQGVLNTPEMAAYNIRAWDIDGNGLPVSTATYAAGRLSGTLTTSPDGAHKWVFSDKDGKPVYEAILLDRKTIASPPNVSTTYEYAYTYYVYDDMGRLRFVLPPKAVSYARSNSWSISSAVLAELCFAYRYDAKGRQFAEHKPGEVSGSTAAYTELVYDKTGRTIMQRSPLEAAQGLWEVILYDDKDRVLTTGLLNNNGSRESWQQNVNTNAAAGASDIGYYLWGAGKNSRPTVSITNFNPQSINYYDSYSNLTAAQTPLYNDGFSSAAASVLVSSTPGAEPYEQRASTFGMLTTTAVKTVKPAGLSGDGLAEWTYSKPFYDKEGRNIYTIHQNATGGKDTLATVYDYMGKVLYSLKYATINLGTARNIKEQYKYVYEDYSGRLLKLQHRTNIQQSWKDLESNSYNELGQLVMKVYGNNAESQAFTYNIRGELKGINEYYALTGDKQERNIRFGEALRYDYGFSVPKYDGNVSGVVWRGANRTLSSAYAYNYDNSGRMLSGVFYRGENTSNTVPATWANDVSNYSEYLGYDEQGNITKLQRWGIKNSQFLPNPPIKMDQLAYTYFANSNKLQKVVDSNTLAFGRGEFVNGSAQGYTYDNSGNLASDLSKGVSSVVYTWFNKPATVTYANGNVIRYVYDAGGSKLGEFITENSTTKKLHYIGNVVLENLVVKYMSTPVGRTNLSNNESKEEFLIKDRLGNVRAVIADVPTGTGIGTLAAQSYSAGYEPADAATEEQLFDKVSEVREEKPGSTGTADAKAALLEGSQQATGTSILLKVMAGDKIAVNAENFYEQLQANPEDVVSGEAVMAQVLNAMAGGAGSLNGSEGGMANALSNGTDPAALQSAYEALQAAETDSTRPRSYLNYLFFDEQMQLVAEQSRLWQADGEADWKTVGTDEAIEVPENGYIAVYLSNQGAEPVYYDNLAVTLTPGALLEEKHYYPYGLPIQGWGTAASGSLPNRQRYQGNEYREEAGLNWMDFHNRQYDPQLGRFLGVDALADAGGQQALSPFHAMGCNPAMMVDPLGLRGEVYDNGARPFYTPDIVAPVWPIANPNAAILKMEANALAWSAYMQEHGRELMILHIYNALLDEYKATSASNNGAKQANGAEQPGNSGSGGNKEIVDLGTGNGGFIKLFGTNLHIPGVSGEVAANQDLGGNFVEGFVDGVKSTVSGVASLFTFEGYVGNLYNTFVNPGEQIGNLIYDVGAKIPNYTAKDYAYGTGFIVQKLIEVVALKKVSSKVTPAVKESGFTLRHYTTEAGYKAIMKSEELWPSIGAKNARHGVGQYFTDLTSGYTSGQISRRLFGVPWNTKKLTHFIDVDMNGLNVIKNAPHNFLVPGTNSLPLNGRIVNHGVSIFK